MYFANYDIFLYFCQKCKKNIFNLQDKLQAEMESMGINLVDLVACSEPLQQLQAGRKQFLSYIIIIIIII
jgi:hypothetical protein